MIKVELIYDSECPNVENARVNLLRAFRSVKIPPEWKEWDRSAPGTPAYARDYGSPAILIGGKDVAGEPPTEANCCRVYEDGSGKISGVPSAEIITEALLKAKPAKTAVGG